MGCCPSLTPARRTAARASRDAGRHPRERGYLAAAQATAVLLGIWPGADPWLAAVVVTVIAALAMLFGNAFGLPPAAYQVVLVGATGTAMASQGADPVRTSLLVLVGGVFAGLVHVVPAMVDLRSPERRIVAAAAEDVAGYLEAIGGPEVHRPATRPSGRTRRG